MTKMIEFTEEKASAVANAFVLDDRCSHFMPADVYAVFFVRAANEAVAAGIVFG